MKGRSRLGAVCTTLSAKTAREMAKKAATAFALGADLVELRVDLLKDPEEGAGRELSHLFRKAIVTVRRTEEGGGFAGSEKERLDLISRLSRASPLYLDIELSTAKENPTWLASLPKKVPRIVSWHDFSGTGSHGSLSTVRRVAAERGKLVKIVTTANDPRDNWNVLELYGEDPRRLIAFCMGEQGMVSRLISLQLGSPIGYAALPNEPVAPGQLSVVTMAEMKRVWEGGSGG